jgi:hypothetical protein
MDELIATLFSAVLFGGVFAIVAYIGEKYQKQIESVVEKIEDNLEDL